MVSGVFPLVNQRKLVDEKLTGIPAASSANVAPALFLPIEILLCQKAGKTPVFKEFLPQSGQQDGY